MKDVNDFLDEANTNFSSLSYPTGKTTNVLEEFEQLREDQGSDVHTKSLLSRRLSSKLNELSIMEDHLVRDVALFGATHEAEILDMYKLTEEELYSKLNDERFLSRVKKLKEETGSDSLAYTRVRAAMYLDAGLDTAHEIANDTCAKSSDRIKALTFIADVAGISNKPTATSVTAKTATGLSVELNFGENHPKKSDLEGIVIRRALSD